MRETDIEMAATDTVEILDLTSHFSPEQFSSLIESKSHTAVFRGAVKSWSAISKWNPLDGGLDYLLEKVGPNAVVEAMMSNDAHVFYGDLRKHEKVAIQFSSFIGSCKAWLEQNYDENSKEKSNFDEISVDNPEKIYLAQVPIFSAEKELRGEKCSLEILRDDIETPSILGERDISSINIWMNRAHSRSSIHYDPHHNLLCIVAGQKQVTLWAPSSSRFLYPMPVYGEASNHSAVNIENPDFSIHARAKKMEDYSDKVTLNPGDALFIPEGWYHQVDSDNLTIGVNFWWESNIMLNMMSHMDAYYLRRILNRMVTKEMNSMLVKSFIPLSKNEENSQTTNEVLKGSEESKSNNDINHLDATEHNNNNIIDDVDNNNNNNNNNTMLSKLDPNALKYMQELISLVHNNINSTSNNNSDESCEQIDKSKQIANYDNAPVSTDEILAKIFLSVKPSVLRKILLAMVESFPRTLEALILHILGPASAEGLTRKFDEMEAYFTKEEQEDFYKTFYGVFEDPSAAMDAILSAKERFAFQAFENVLNLYLGAQAIGPN